MYQKKNQRFVRLVALVIALAMVLMTGVYLFSMTGWFAAAGAGSFSVHGAGDPDRETRLARLSDFLDFLEETYKDELTDEALFHGLYQGLFDALGDPWSVYYPRKETADRLAESIQGDYSGVGIVMTQTDAGISVSSVTPDSPAQKAGVRSGDVIRAVDGISVEGLDTYEVSLLVRGPAGSAVSLTLERIGSRLTLSMVRAVIHSPSVFSREVEAGIGYIQITSFDSDTDREFTAARLTLLQSGVKGLIIDLRDNGGGLMSQALAVAEQLTQKGAILAHYEQQGHRFSTITSAGSAVRQVPLVVLINPNTASAAECLAAALADNDAAVLVGQTSYGKGVAQVISDLDGDAAYKLSVFYFLTPQGRRIEGLGVTPDLMVRPAGGLEPQEIARLAAELVPMNEQQRYYAGDLGLNVYGAQQRLRLLGYDAPGTGVMDAATQSVIRAFQKNENLYPYGGLDFSTMGALSDALETYLYGGSDDLPLEAALKLLR